MLPLSRARKRVTFTETFSALLPDKGIASIYTTLIVPEFSEAFKKTKIHLYVLELFKDAHRSILSFIQIADNDKWSKLRSTS